jgi:hypothetical protein
MTSPVLKLIKQDQKDIEIFLNDHNEIYIGEEGNVEESPYLFFTTINQEEWIDIKRFIDKQFRSINP